MQIPGALPFLSLEIAVRTSAKVGGSQLIDSSGSAFAAATIRSAYLLYTTVQTSYFTQLKICYLMFRGNKKRLFKLIHYTWYLKVLICRLKGVYNYDS